jgi:inorganic pyrophosphatase
MLAGTEFYSLGFEQVFFVSSMSGSGTGELLDAITALITEERAEIIVPARVVGGLQLLDRGEADDKIIAVVEGDFVWGTATEIANLPPIMVERLQHYFQTYKLVPGAKPQITVQRVYGVEHAAQVVEAAAWDYRMLLADR